MADIFSNIPGVLPEELTEVLAASETVRIERIVSKGHTSPEGFWYDQDEHEFVIVVKGEGSVRFEDGREVLLRPGEWLDIPAGTKHRVTYTRPDEATVWLAVFYT